MPASLFVGGLVRLIASKKVISPAWYDYLWFAFGTYCTLNRGMPPGEPAARPTAPDPKPVGSVKGSNGAAPSR